MSEMDGYNAIMRDLTIPRADKLAAIQRGWSIWAEKYPDEDDESGNDAHLFETQLDELKKLKK